MGFTHKKRKPKSRKTKVNRVRTKKIRIGGESPRKKPIDIDDIEQSILPKHIIKTQSILPKHIIKTQSILPKNIIKVKSCKLNNEPNKYKIYIKKDNEIIPMDDRYNKRIIGNCKNDSNCQFKYYGNCWVKYHDDLLGSDYWFNKITGEARWTEYTPINKKQSFLEIIPYNPSTIEYNLGTQNNKKRLSPIKNILESHLLPIDNKKSRTQKRRMTV